jgi:glycerol-3-phosphate acyltransferase PlsX
VFKSHGSADALAFETALTRAYEAARHELLDKVRARIAHAAPLLSASSEDNGPMQGAQA